MPGELKVFNKRPYYDDYDESKKFLQILFRPSLAVQARELTQMQTILQNQISRIGSHFFDNGARIINGETKYYRSIPYIKLATDPSLTVTQLESLIGTTIKKTTGNLEAKIIHFELPIGTDSFTLYLEYISGDGGNDDRFVNGDVFTLSLNRANYTAFEVGNGSLYSVNSGVYYINSRFVLVDRQTIAINKYSPVTSNVSIGFLIEDKIVTPDEDNSLFDNAIGSTNENAPGATRYKMIATLAVKPEGGSNFVEIVNLQAGEPTTNANLTDYTKVFQEIFARRTYDESGDYIVNDFLLDIQEYYNDGTNRGKYDDSELSSMTPSVTVEEAKTRISLTLEAGKAYVRGYEVETYRDIPKHTNKARDTLGLVDEYSSISYSNQVTVNLPVQTIIFDSTMFLNSITGANVISFRNSGNVELYKAKAIYIKNSGHSNEYDIVFRDLVATTSNSNIINVTKIVFSVSNLTFNVVPGTIITDANDSVYFFRLPYSVTSSVYKSQFDIYKKQIFLSQSSLTMSIPDINSNNENDYVVLNGNKIYTPENVDVGSKTITLHSSAVLTPSNSTIVLYRVNVNNLPIVKKTKTIGYSYPINEVQFNTSPLNIDGYRLVSVLDSTNQDITTRFEFNNGQTNTLYDRCTVKLKNGQVHSTFPYVITYEYFTWDNNDNGFCTVDSYTNGGVGISLEDIYSYKGENLGNYLDFRRRVDAESYAIADDGFAITDYSVYLPRKDKIILDKNGNMLVLNGISSLKPQLPKDVDDSITLYELDIPAYTYKLSDVGVNKLNYRRYTMKDISNIERRVESLEYYTSLSMLENDINNKNYIDKFKSGFLVDNFDTFTPSQNDSVHYKVAIDFDNNQMRPQSIVSALDLDYDRFNSSGIKKHSNGIVTLDYKSVKMVEQPFATQIERIQPFIKYTWEGNITLNPPFDNWVTTDFIDTTLDLGTGIGASQRANEIINQIFNSPSRIFTGTQAGTVVNANTSSSTQQLTTGWTRLFSTTTATTQTQFAGSRVVDVSAIPFIRSRLVEFIGTGFKPNTKVIPYFDGIDVGNYCANEMANIIENRTSSGIEHISTPPNNEFIIGADGKVRGYFYIPSNEKLRFKTGNRRFELKDVLVNPSTFGEAIYTANGTHTTIQNTFVTTRQVATSFFWRDPIAQSFTVDSQEGAFITGIKLFFNETLHDNKDDVTVQIRSMSNGLPTSKIVASKTMTSIELKNPIDAVNNKNEIKTVGTVSYSFNSRLFVFDSPVYLESNNEYAFVVLTNSESLSVWTCILGQQDVLSGNYVNKQPYLGSMFKSQNNTTWTVDQLQDIKFEIQKAEFTQLNGKLGLIENVSVTDKNTEADPFIYIVKDNVFQYNTFNIPVVKSGSGYTCPPSLSFDMVLLDSSTIPMTVIVTNGRVESVTVTNDVSVNGKVGGVNEAASYNNLNAALGTTFVDKVVLDFNGFNRIKVKHPTHGFKNGDTVYIKNVVDPVLMPDEILPVQFYSELNRPSGHTVIYINMDEYYIANPFDSISGNTSKGRDIFSFGTNPSNLSNFARMSQMVEYSQVKLLTDSIVLNGTALEYKLTSLKRGGQVETNNLTDLVVNDLGKLYFTYADGPLTTKGRLTVDFSSTSKNISPVIDIPRMTMYAYSNRFSGLSDSKTVNGVTYQTYDAESRYLTKNIKLINPANQIELYLDLNLPSSTSIEVYVKTDIKEITVEDDNEWQKLEVDKLIYSQKGVFNEHKFTKSTVNFTNYMIKILFLQQIDEVTLIDLKRANPPIIEKLRVIALSK